MWSSFSWSRLPARLRRHCSLGILYQCILGELQIMPSCFHLTVGLGGTALVVGFMAFWLHEPQPPSSLSEGFTTFSPRVVGNSALSHGGPLPNRRMAADPSPAQFQIGQELIVAASDNVSHTTTLLPFPPNSITSSSTIGETTSLLPGTVIFVSGIQAIEPAAGRTEQYYQVTTSDGRKGWLSERVLRTARIEIDMKGD